MLPAGFEPTIPAVEQLTGSVHVLIRSTFSMFGEGYQQVLLQFSTPIPFRFSERSAV
jgi:hypothetical protein